MALKNFIKAESYSRIEDLTLYKTGKVILFSLSVYADDTKAEKLIDAIRFNIPVDSGLETQLSQDVNFIGLCYEHLKTRTEFQGTEDC